MNAAESILDLYRETVLEHSRHPHNRRVMEAAEAVAEGHNPLCGDRVTLYLRLDSARVADASFAGDGCAIALASASMLTDLVRGRSVTDVRAIGDAVQRMLAGKDAGRDLGAIESLSGVLGYPARVRCAALPWRTLDAALAGAAGPVSTEG